MIGNMTLNDIPVFIFLPLRKCHPFISVLNLHLIPRQHWMSRLLILFHKKA